MVPSVVFLLPIYFIKEAFTLFFSFILLPVAAYFCQEKYIKCYRNIEERLISSEKGT